MTQTTDSSLPVAPASISALVQGADNRSGYVIVNVGAGAAGGTLVPLSPAGNIGDNSLVLYNWNPATQLTNFLAAEAAVAAGTPGARAKIVAVGDSTSLGYGSAMTDDRALSYPVEMARTLAADGMAAQCDNILGGPASLDDRIALAGAASFSGMTDAGGDLIHTTGAGQGADFTLNNPGTYDRVDVDYMDTGTGSLTVGVDGGPVLATVQLTNTGQTKTATIDIPAGLHTQVNIRAAAAATYIEGVSFWNSTTPALEVYDAGVGGVDSTAANTSVYQGKTLIGSANGAGETAGAAALKPNLAIIDIGINDINSALDTTAQTVANISDMISTLRGAGADVIVMIPQPFNDASYATALPALRSALESLSQSQNVPLIDLSATYGDSYTALYQGAGLMFDNLHPDATLYADIGSKIGNLLASAITAEVACFAAGTAITTPGGDVPIEQLRAGDMVVTADGAQRAIKWLGYRSIDIARHARPAAVAPVRIQAGAFADGLPARDLYLSPDHAIYMNGVLIPAKHLLNGISVTQVFPPRITYHHIELETHNIILAEGLTAETWLDCGNRSGFANANPVMLHPEFAPAAWDHARACAELTASGEKLHAVKQLLISRLLQTGHSLHTAAPRLMSHGTELRPVSTGGDIWRYLIPAGAPDLVLHAATGIPAETNAASEDRRRLGLAINHLAINGKALPLDHPAITTGFHLAAGDHRWTTGQATLPACLWSQQTTPFILEIGICGRQAAWRQAA